MKKPTQILLTLAIIFALTSITFTLGNSLTGNILLTRMDLGLHFSYMTMITLAITSILLLIELSRYQKPSFKK